MARNVFSIFLSEKSLPQAKCFILWILTQVILYRRHEKQPLRPQINFRRVLLVSRCSHNGAYLIL